MKCPRPMCPQTKSFGLFVPWTRRPLDKASLGRYGPMTTLPLDDLSPRRQISWRMLPLDDLSPRRQISWRMLPLDDVSLGRCVPWQWRSWPMCPDPGRRIDMLVVTSDFGLGWVAFTFLFSLTVVKTQVFSSAQFFNKKKSRSRNSFCHLFSISQVSHWNVKHSFRI
jgi:hypothetical protein